MSGANHRTGHCELVAGVPAWASRAAAGENLVRGSKNKVTALTCPRRERTSARWVKDPLDTWSSAVAGVMGFLVSSRGDVNAGVEKWKMRLV